MRKRSLLAIVSAATVLATLSLLADEVVVIVNRSAGIESATKHDIELVFKGKKTEISGVKIKPVVQDKGDAHKAFLSEYVAKSPSQFHVYWRRMLFTGCGTPPLALSENELVEHVSKHSNAIGYVSKATFDSNKDKVKAVSIGQ